MSTQTLDTIIYEGEPYELVGLECERLQEEGFSGLVDVTKIISNTGLIKPSVFGIETTAMHTGCYRGYYSTYEIDDKGTIILKEMTLKASGDNYKPLNNVEPEFVDCCAVYKNINFPVKFTGKIRIRRYLSYVELTYEEGNILEVKRTREKFEPYKDKAGKEAGKHWFLKWWENLWKK